MELAADAALPRVSPGVRALFERFSFDRGVPKLEYFPDQRELTRGEAKDEDAERRLRPTRSRDKYASLIPWLIQTSLDDGSSALEQTRERGLLFADDRPNALGPLNGALAILAPELRIVAAHAGGRELLMAHRDGSTMAAHELSAGQRQALLFAASFLRLGLDRSLVLVDMPELYLHGADHEAFVRGLMRLGSQNQFIIATGSSAVVGVAGRDETIVLRREQER